MKTNHTSTRALCIFLPSRLLVFSPSRLLAFFVVSSFLGLAAPVRAQNLITNGGFESPAQVGPIETFLSGVNTTFVTSWTAQAAGSQFTNPWMSLSTGAGGAPGGDNAIYTANGGTLTTSYDNTLVHDPIFPTSGLTYEVRWDMGFYNGSGSYTVDPGNTLEVQVYDLTTSTVLGLYTYVAGTTITGFESRLFDFVGTGNPTQVRFSDTALTGTAGSVTKAWDNFSVTPVPEPSGALLLGIAGVLGILRRRNR